MARLEKVVTIVVPIFFSLVVLVGFFGNLLVVLVVTFNRQVMIPMQEKRNKVRDSLNFRCATRPTC